MSSKSYITPAEVIAVKEKYPDESIIIADVAKVRRNSNKSRPTQYIPVLIKRLVGKPTRCQLKINAQVACSNAKLPYGADDEKEDVKVSNVLLLYRKIEVKDLEETDYKENQHDSLVASNNEFTKALEIIATDYLRTVEEQVLVKNKHFKVKNKDVHCFMQTRRDATDDEKKENDRLDEEEKYVDEDDKVALDYPLFRLKIKANQETQELGYSSGKDRKHVYMVYDIRKMSGKNKNGKKGKPQIAKVKTGERRDKTPIYSHLTTTNARHFITYMSLTGGLIEFDSICLSTFGVSLMNKFKELYVWPHKPMNRQSIDEEDIDMMAQLGTSGYDDEATIPDDEDEKVERKSSRSKKSSKKSSSKNTADDEYEEEYLDENDSDSEPDDNQEESSEEDDDDDSSSPEPEEEDEPPKKSKPRRSRK